MLNGKCPYQNGPHLSMNDEFFIPRKPCAFDVVFIRTVGEPNYNYVFVKNC